MWFVVGNAGWIRAEGPELPGLLYVKLARDGSSRWRTSQIFLEGDTPLTGEDLRRLPLAVLEARANGPELGPRLEAAMKEGRPAPQLDVLASHFSTNSFGTNAKHWVADSFRAQLDPKMPQPRKIHTHPAPAEDLADTPPLSAPNGAKLTDEFLRQVHRAYDAAVARGEWPAVALAEQTGVTPHAVRKWIYTARKRGIMPPGRQGTVS